MRCQRLMPLSALGFLLAACLGSSSGLTDPDVVGQGRRALFIGNSYLYFADIPGMVQALSDSAAVHGAGERIAVATLAGPDMALIDHWNEGSAVKQIRKGGWDWVVLQQGPSSVEVNRDSLRALTLLFNGEIAKISARPALFSAWPSESRRQDFPRAIESYTLAAADVGGILLPVAAAWLAAWNRDPATLLYYDGLHPTRAGAYLSALVIYARLTGTSPVGLPAVFRLHEGTVVGFSAEEAALLQAAAAEVVQAGPSQ